MALRADEASMLDLASRASKLYRVAQKITKDDGTIRVTYDAFKPLKDVHRLIKSEILDRVTFPDYLTGSLKGKDYKTNAALHKGAKIVISEDIGTFFPATTTAIVFDIWRNFFGFSDAVARCLTQLTSRNNELPQGAITSPQLANLVFWRDEPKLHATLAEKGIVYSRFVDDVAASSRSHMETTRKTDTIASISAMMGRRGYAPKRKKHEIATAGSRMVVTKLTVNERPGLAKAERSRIRAAVHALERDVSFSKSANSLEARIPKVVGKVSTLGRFHPGKANTLKKRLAVVRLIIGT